MTVLNDEQCARFFDTMDSLLYFVNERFRVVEGFTLDYDGQIGDMKAALVARTLWENVEVIDDFVRENPARLPQRCLDTALAWKAALPGLYAVVRYQGGRAILMNDVGVFSVGGVTLEIEGEIGKAPAYVDLVLLPFDDGIVYDGFLQAYDGDGSAEEAARIQDEFEDRCAGGIVSSAEEFARVAGAHLAAVRDREIEALLEDVAREAAGGAEVLPAGFHRGVLADAGKGAGSGAGAGAGSGSGEAAGSGSALRAEGERKLAPTHSKSSVGIADGLPGEPRESSVGIADGLPGEPRESSVGVAGGSPGEPRESSVGVAGGSPVEPQKVSDGLPGDAREAFGGGEESGGRTEEDVRADRAVNCAIACVLARGIEEIGDAYGHYCALAPEPLSREEFEALVRHEATFTDSYFGIWSFEGRDYLAYYTLTADYITQMASLGGDWRGLREELDYYEQFRRNLLEARREVAPKPLSRTLLENTPLGELLHDENAERLRRFLNERIPDGQDDLTFADAATQEFVLTAVESGSLEELYRLAEDLGVMGCCADEERLPRLVTNVYNAMPSWENNGWSPQELYEQLTGRRVFYNEDGTVMKVGGDDPCPCGSGEKYRDCCGR